MRPQAWLLRPGWRNEGGTQRYAAMCVPIEYLYLEVRLGTPPFRGVPAVPMCPRVYGAMATTNSDGIRQMSTSKTRLGRKPASPRASASPAAATDEGQTLRIAAEPGKSQARMFADLVTKGIATNGITATTYTGGQLGAVPISEMVQSLQEAGEVVNRGDLSNAERILNAQALTLNAIFAELARRAAVNMGEHLGAMETYMRLALKAQSQSRATFETLAAIKNPPIVYARQMNVANGPQQVNNSVANPGDAPLPHTKKSEIRPNKLLEDSANSGNQSGAGAMINVTQRRAKVR